MNSIQASQIMGGNGAKANVGGEVIHERFKKKVEERA